MPTVTLFLNEILDAIKKTPDKTQQIVLLRQNDCQAVRQVMYANFADSVVFRLPPGPTPYKPHDVPVGMAATNIFKLARQIYLFIENSSAKLNQKKVETLWINMLENVQKDEAIVLESMRNKAFTKDYSLTRDVVDAAYPGLLPPDKATVVVPVAPVHALVSKPVVDASADAKAEAKRLKRNEYARKYAARDRAEAKAAKLAAAQPGVLEFSVVDKKGE